MTGQTKRNLIWKLGLAAWAVMLVLLVLKFTAGTQPRPAFGLKGGPGCVTSYEPRPGRTPGSTYFRATMTCPPVSE